MTLQWVPSILLYGLTMGASSLTLTCSNVQSCDGMSSFYMSDGYISMPSCYMAHQCGILSDVNLLERTITRVHVFLLHDSSSTTDPCHLAIWLDNGASSLTLPCSSVQSCECMSSCCMAQLQIHAILLYGSTMGHPLRR